MLQQPHVTALKALTGGFPATPIRLFTMTFERGCKDVVLLHKRQTQHQNFLLARHYICTLQAFTDPLHKPFSFAKGNDCEY